jgi:hypothetical protein
MSGDGLVDSEEELEASIVRKSPQAEADFDCGESNKTTRRKHLKSPQQLDCMSLEQRTSAALKEDLDVDNLNSLLQDLANRLETDALVRVWDTRGNTAIRPATWQAMEQLHTLGKGKIPGGTIHPESDRRRLAPARRLHKILKGKRVSARSTAAKDHVSVAVEYIRAHPKSLANVHRSVQAKVLKKALQIDLETARGLITKLKQKKLIDAGGNLL